MNRHVNILPDFLYNSHVGINVLEVIDMPTFITNLGDKIINICPICLNPCIIPSKINSCMHIYCNKCINKWLKVSNKCPLCRRNFDKINIIN